MGHSGLQNSILIWKVLAENSFNVTELSYGSPQLRTGSAWGFSFMDPEAAPWHQKHSVNATPFRIGFWDWLTLFNDIRETFNKSTVFLLVQFRIFSEISTSPVLFSTMGISVGNQLFSEIIMRRGVVLEQKPFRAIRFYDTRQIPCETNKSVSALIIVLPRTSFLKYSNF